VSRVANVEIHQFWTEKMNGSTISFFSHSTGTTCDKNKSTEKKKKNKDLKPREAKGYLTLISSNLIFFKTKKNKNNKNFVLL
jgi:hypothetical protein